MNDRNRKKSYISGNGKLRSSMCSSICDGVKSAEYRQEIPLSNSFFTLMLQTNEDNNEKNETDEMEDFSNAKTNMKNMDK